MAQTTTSPPGTSFIMPNTDTLPEKATRAIAVV